MDRSYRSTVLQIEGFGLGEGEVEGSSVPYVIDIVLQCSIFHELALQMARHLRQCLT